ncbi:hypothetical protein [Clostridium botulinum]|uniref:hypothetical protein n=1 Tax=Clostridium botulinum TaxID=1491 RepID=UPI000A23E96A|nr:hypothetical protein [Clostridium botulinum]AUN10687.1 hypothetical protein RSJ6_09305 [Clostridium botulinum]OSA71064.1 hypothetical protein B2H87_11930 [Clostridium botulinum]
MEKSGFFNAMKVGDTWDRIYKAENYAEYFASFIGNGVFPNPSTNLQVIGTDRMQVIVKPGKGWINGYKYENTDDLILSVDVADGVLHRIDKIVLRYDVVEREIRVKIKKGEFASEPKAPQLTRDADMYELGLADIKVNAGSISITQAYITDLRLNKELCGIVHGTVDQVDTTTIFNQYLEWYKNITGKTEQELQNIKENLKTDFMFWFDGLKETLSGDVAGNLLNLINTNTENIKTKVSSQELNEFKDDTASQLADITTDENRLTEDKTITGAINELFTNANNLKKNWVEVIGEPLSEIDLSDQLKSKTQALKNTFVANLVNKGQSAVKTDSLNILINKVADIKTEPKTGDKINFLAFDSDIQLKTIWSYEFDENINNLDMLSSNIDNSAYVIVTKECNVYKFDNNGNVLWKKSLPSYKEFLKVDNNDNLYIQTDNSNIEILNKDGVKIRSLILTSDPAGIGVSNDGKYVFCVGADSSSSFRYNIFKLDTTSGKIVEEKKESIPNSFQSVSVIAGNKQVYVKISSMLYCYAFDCSIIWEDIIDHRYPFYNGKINKTDDSLLIFNYYYGLCVYSKYGNRQVYDSTNVENAPRYDWLNGGSLAYVPYRSSDLIVFYNSYKKTYLYFYSSPNFIITKNNDILYAESNKIHKMQYLATVI